MVVFSIKMNVINGEVELATSHNGTGEQIAKAIAIGLASMELKQGLSEGIMMRAVNTAYQEIDEGVRQDLLEGLE